MSQPPNANPAVEFYLRWCEKIPYVTRTLVLVIIVEYILSFFIKLEEYFGDVPRYTVFHFQIYRLFLSPLVGNSILTLILILMSFPSMGSRLEWGMGSASYLALLGTIALATNVIFASLCYVLYMFGTESAMWWNCMGFWTILFALITIECLQVKSRIYWFVCLCDCSFLSVL